MKGLEPSTPGATVQCSAIELHPPCFVARPEGGYADRHAVIALLTSLRHTRSLSHAQEMRQEGIEPPTHGLEGRCSIQLSYWRTPRISYLVKRIASKGILTTTTRDTRTEIRDTFFRVGVRGFEPPTPCAQGRCATRLRYTPLNFASPLPRLLRSTPLTRHESQSEKRHPANKAILPNQDTDLLDGCKHNAPTVVGSCGETPVVRAAGGPRQRHDGSPDSLRLRGSPRKSSQAAGIERLGRSRNQRFLSARH